MRKSSTAPEIRFSAGFFFALALMLLVLPIKWIAAFAVASACHEFCHLLALRLLSARVGQIRIGVTGTVMESQPMSRGKELLCALAGPLGGLLLLPAARWLPRTAICAAFQSLYNLLPVYPLDGGRALTSLAFMILPPVSAQRFTQLVELSCLCAVGLLAVYAAFGLRLGFLPLLFAGMLIFRVKKNSLQTEAREGTIVLP